LYCLQRRFHPSFDENGFMVGGVVSFNESIFIKPRIKLKKNIPFFVKKNLNLK
jgi:hypothetical protein